MSFPRRSRWAFFVVARFPWSTRVPGLFWVDLHRDNSDTAGACAPGLSMRGCWRTVGCGSSSLKVGHEEGNHEVPKRCSASPRQIRRARGPDRACRRCGHCAIIAHMYSIQGLYTLLASGSVSEITTRAYRRWQGQDPGGAAVGDCRQAISSAHGPRTAPALLSLLQQQVAM